MGGPPSPLIHATLAKFAKTSGHSGEKFEADESEIVKVLPSLGSRRMQSSEEGRGREWLIRTSEGKHKIWDIGLGIPLQTLSQAAQHHPQLYEGIEITQAVFLMWLLCHPTFITRFQFSLVDRRAPVELG